MTYAGLRDVLARFIMFCYFVANLSLTFVVREGLAHITCGAVLQSMGLLSLWVLDFSVVVMSVLYVYTTLILLLINLTLILVVFFPHINVNGFPACIVALRIHRVCMYLWMYLFDKILSYALLMSSNVLYLTKVVLCRKQLGLIALTLILSGQPLCLIFLFRHLSCDRENLNRVRGGGNDKKNKPTARKKVTIKLTDHSNHLDKFNETQLNGFNRKMAMGKRDYVDRLSDNERTATFKHLKNNRCKSLPIVSNSALNVTWYDHPFSFQVGKDQRLKCSNFFYHIATLDGIGKWKHGNNTCLWDCIFGLFCNSMIIKNDLDFDMCLYRFNEASVNVTRQALNGTFGLDIQREYTNWLNDHDLLMADDLLLFLVRELHLKIILIRNWVGEDGVGTQTLEELGEGTRANGVYHPNLIAGVVTNLLQPAHFSIVSSISLRHDFDNTRNDNHQYGLNVKDFIWSYKYRNATDCAFIWKKCPAEVVIDNIPDVAKDLKVRGCLKKGKAESTFSKFSREVAQENPELGSETTSYSKSTVEDVDSDVPTKEELEEFDAMMGSHSVKTEEIKESSKPKTTVAAKVGTSDRLDDDGEAKGAKLEPVMLEATSISPPPECDRFEGVEGRLVWNRRNGIPTAITLETTSNPLIKFLLEIFAEDGLGKMIFSSTIVRKYIEMTQPRSLFRNTKKGLRLVDVATYLSSLNSRHQYFARFVSARKKLEGVTQHIDNPKFLNSANIRYQSRKLEDSLQWKHYKTVDAREKYDYAASVNQIHEKQILYLANMVEYVEVNWENDNEMLEFINTCVEQIRYGIEIPRIYVPYYKKIKIGLYHTGDSRRPYCCNRDLACKDSDGDRVPFSMEVRAKMDVFGNPCNDQYWDSKFQPIGVSNYKQVIVKTVKVNDWDDLEDFERIMLLASLSSAYKAVNSSFMFDMGIAVELMSPKVIAGQYDYESLCKRIDTVAASTISKFNTNKLTHHYGVHVELNSIRVAKAIARSYVEKLNLKQHVDELPDDLYRSVKDSVTNVKNVKRVYGNSPFVNNVARSIIGYRTDEISDMPVIKEVVRNFKICDLDEQRESNTIVRKMTALTNYNVYGCLSPIPDTGDANNVREGFMKRIGCAVPEPDDSVKMLLPMYVDHFINFYHLDGKITEMLAGEMERYMDWDQYKLTLRYDPARLKQLEEIRKEVDQLDTFDFADNAEGRFQNYLWTKIEAHVKWESYKGEMKYARLIFARVDWFKVFYGSYAKIMQQCIYECLEQFCCTNLPVKDLPKHMVDKYSLCALILSTDFSAFESHNYPWVMRNIFFKFMMRMWGYEFNVELYVSMGVLTGTNIIENVFVWCKVDAKVMSGEVWTSIINWFTNLIFIFFIVECEGYAYCTGFFVHEFSFKFFRGVKIPPVHTFVVFTAAGDDGMTGLPWLSWVDYSKLSDASYLWFYGVNLKLEMKESIAGSGFLSKLYSENDMHTLCDPIKQLAKGILPLKYANAKVGVKKALARARAMSLLYEFGGCPIVASYALCIIRCTRNVQLKRALILAQKDDWYKFKAISEAVEWYENNVKGKYDTWKCEIGMESRQIVEDNFGIPVCTQLYIEEYFDQVDDTSYPLEFNVPCIDLVCSPVEQEFFEKYTCERKTNDQSFEVCISYQKEREWVSEAPRTASSWFDFLNRDCFYSVAAAA